MDYSVVAPKTCVLKVNLHCPACEKKVHKALKKINGVCSISIDGEHGKVTVSGNVDPYTLIMALSKTGKKAELLWVHSQPTNHHQNQSKPAQETDPHLEAQMAQLHKLSQLKHLKQVELTHSKSLRLMFKGHKDDVSQKNETKSTDDVHGPTTGAAAPCSCGCHTKHCCHEVAGTSRANCVHHENCNGSGPPLACRCIPAAPPPVCNNCAQGHGAPPPEAQPPVAYPHTSIFSDHNPSSCKLM